MRTRARRRAGILGALLAALPVWPERDASAQSGIRPSQTERPELREFETRPPPPTSLELPPLPPPSERALGPGIRVHVGDFRIEGSTVFDPEELARLVEPYRGRGITSEELLGVADAITAHYQQHGYLTSGALIPDQDLRDGVVVVQVVEGRLVGVEVEGARWFRPGYFRTRLERAGRAPVDVERLERELQRLQQDPRVERVNARLGPGARRGESLLSLEVEEGPPAELVFRVANDEPPTIGAAGGEIVARFSNLAGRGDVFEGSIELTSGLVDWSVSYELPVGARDTRLRLYYRRSEADIIEEPFDALDIVSESETFEVGLEHPILRTPNHELWLGVTGARRRSRTDLDGACFKTVGDDCDSIVSVLRPFAEWTWRTRDDVLAVRSTGSIGIGAFGATTQPGSDSEDSRFTAWLGQLQWAHRLPERFLGTQVVSRFDIQLSDDPLLSIEKFSIGGMRTVRGYRENELVTDNGVIASAELRIPVWREPLGRPILQLVPFLDFGRGWEDGFETSDSIASIGTGLRLSPWPWLLVEFYWGGRLRRVPRPEDHDLQDSGFHFQVRATPLDLFPGIWARKQGR